MVGFGIDVGEQLFVVERDRYGQGSADALRPIRNQDIVPRAGGAAVAAGGALEASQHVEEELVDEENGAEIDVKPGAGRLPALVAAARGDEVVGVDIGIEEILWRRGHSPVEEGPAVGGADADIVADG